MPRERKTRLVASALLAALVLLLLAAPGAPADVITPESRGSPNADDIDTLYKITLYIGIVIFLIVEATLLWSIVRFRARRGGQAAQIHGNTPLEMGWTVAAALILVVLATITFIYLPRIENPPASGPGGLAQQEGQLASISQSPPPKSGGPTLNVKVNGQQYIWRYDYPGAQQLFSYYEMVVPTNTTVTLDITASDVVHSWWIPKLGGKADAVPGHHNYTWFKIKQPGLYKGQCAELCGYNHADMRAVVRALPPAAFQAWARRQRADIAAAKKAVGAARKQRLRTGQIQ